MEHVRLESVAVVELRTASLGLGGLAAHLVVVSLGTLQQICIPSGEEMLWRRLSEDACLRTEGRRDAEGARASSRSRFVPAASSARRADLLKSDDDMATREEGAG